MVLAVALTAAPPAAVESAQAACPPPVMGLPRYPVAQLKSNVSGTTVVLARIDDCGRVLEAKVHAGSGESTLDEAALDTVRAWVLSPAQIARVGGPWVKLPVKFGGLQNVVPRAPAWPKSHRRPRYLPDDEPVGFDSIQAFHAAGQVKPDVLKSPYSSVRNGNVPEIMTSFMEDRDDPRVFWLAYIVHRQGRSGAENTVAVARYRLLDEAGGPVVRVALLCEAGETACGKLRAFLLEGLPTAKPPRD